AWIRLVLRDIFTDGLPYAVEHARTSRELNTAKISVTKNDIGCIGATHIDQVDYTIGQAGFFQHLHDDIGSINLGVAWLPHHGVTHQGHTRWQIPRDRSEVEWGKGEKKPFERSIFYSVPDAG